MGGRSSSSADSTNQTTNSSATSTGTVGDVVQGQTININQDLPDAAVDVFRQLVALSGQAIDIAGHAGQAALDTVAASGQRALDSTNAFASSTKQPDLTLLQGYQKQVFYAIGAVAAVVAITFIFRKK